MYNWDYNLKKGWKPATEGEWLWYLERMLNYGEFKGLNPKVVKKYFLKLKLDEGKKELLQAYFKRYAK